MELLDINAIDIYKKWKKASNVFEAFIRSGPFVSLKTYDNITLDLSIDSDLLYKNHKKIISKIINLSKNTFVICDLNFDDSTEIGFLLNNRYDIKPIISFNMIFCPHGLIGTDRNIENLIKYGLNLKDINPSGYAILCNYERYQDFSDDLYKKRLNNQYELCDDDLPYAETLTSSGYSNVVVFTKEKIKDDLLNYINYLMDSSIIVEVFRGF